MTLVGDNSRVFPNQLLGIATVEIKEKPNKSKLLGREIKIFVQSKLSSFKSLLGLRASTRPSLLSGARSSINNSEGTLSSYKAYGRVYDFDLNSPLTARIVDVASTSDVSKFKSQTPESVISASDSEKLSLSPETLSFIKGTKELENFFSDVFEDYDNKDIHQLYDDLPGETINEDKSESEPNIGLKTISDGILNEVDSMAKNLNFLDEQCLPPEVLSYIEQSEKLKQFFSDVFGDYDNKDIHQFYADLPEKTIKEDGSKTSENGSFGVTSDQSENTVKKLKLPDWSNDSENENNELKREFDDILNKLGLPDVKNLFDN